MQLRQAGLDLRRQEVEEEMERGEEALKEAVEMEEEMERRAKAVEEVEEIERRGDGRPKRWWWRWWTRWTEGRPRR